MSGFISSAIGKAESLGSALSSAAGGVNSVLSAVGAGFQLPFGSSGPVTLGSFVFQGFEVPASVSWGGRQAMTVHRLPGGARVIDTTGPDDAEVAWSGVFLGSDAADRARALNELRSAGDPLPLVWNDNHLLAVVISDFHADERMTSHVPYTISCTVAGKRDANSGSSSLFGQIMSDLNAATGINLMQAAGGALSAVTGVASAVAAVTGGNAAVLNVLGDLTAASSSVSAAQAVSFRLGASATTQATASLQATNDTIKAELSDTGVSSAGMLAPSLTPAGGIPTVSAIVSAITQSGIAAQLSEASGYVGRALANARNGAT